MGIACFETWVRSVAAKNGKARLSLYVEMDVLVEDVAVELDVLVLVEEPELELDVDDRTSVPVSSPAR